MPTYKIAVLPGDGIGKEITSAAVGVLNAVGEKYNKNFEMKEAPVGWEAYKLHKTCLPKETLSICKKSDAILLGAVGHPDADKLAPEDRPERAALLPLRKKFDLFANLRPAKVFPELVDSSPLKRSIVEQGIDMLIVRELTGDVYFGKPKGIKGKGDAEAGFDMMKYSRKEVKRIAKVAFEFAQKRRKKLTSVDKANVLSSSVLWRKVVDEVAGKYSDVKLEHYYVDNAAMQLVKNPGQFDVMLCGNMFGDILSDEASTICGSLGMLPSASINEKKFGLFEPIHGSAPKYEGMNVVNPIATIMSTSMMLEHSFGLKKEAAAVEGAVKKALQQGYRTRDIYAEGMKLLGTREMGKKIAEFV